MTRFVHLAVTLVILFAVTILSLSVGPAVTTGGRLAVYAGFILLVASVSGSLAARAGLPRITGFLVVGMMVGPSLMGILSGEVVEQLALIDEFALALIALLAGGELKIGQLRPAARAIATTTLAVTGVVTVGVAAAVVLLRPLIPFLAAEPMAVGIAVALLLGIWASNSSPDLTVAVIEEMGVKGPLSDVILGVTIVKDVVVIVLFTLALSLVSPVFTGEGASATEVLGHLLTEVGGAIVVGAVLGWVFSFYLGGEGQERPPLATFLFAFVIVVLAERLHLELLLVGVSAGFVIENLSPAGDRMIRGIESVSVVIFAFFFAVAGAKLDLGALGSFWLAALVLLGVRLLLTRLGARVGTRMAGSDERIQSRTWRGLISQGGVTLGLLSTMSLRVPEALGEGVVALGTAVILGNILGGPVLLKSALSGGDGSGAEGGAAATTGAAQDPAPVEGTGTS